MLEAIKVAGAATALVGLIAAAVHFTWSRMKPKERWSAMQEIPPAVTGVVFGLYVLAVHPAVFGVSLIDSMAQATLAIVFFALSLYLGFKIQTLVLWFQLRGPDGTKIADEVLRESKPANIGSCLAGGRPDSSGGA